MLLKIVFDVVVALAVECLQIVLEPTELHVEALWVIDVRHINLHTRT